MKKAKLILIDFFNTLSIYDYIGFFIMLFLFFLFIILALLVRKRTLLAIFLMLLSFFSLFAGPILAHKLIKNTFFKSVAELSEVKQLFYSDTLIIRGVLNYRGMKDANHCTVEADVYKKGSNMVKEFVYSLKSFRSESKDIDQSFTEGDSINFKIVIEPFNYKGDYNITVNSGCYR